MIALDTSAVLALLNAADPDHKRVKEALTDERGPYLVPAGILAEVGYLGERDLGTAAVAAFVEDLERGDFVLDCGDEDLKRVRELIVRYEDLGLGLADAFVIACAERNGGKVLTLDRRDFDVVAGEGKLTVLP